MAVRPLLALFFSCVAQSGHAEEQKSVVAVFDIKDTGAGVDAKVLHNLTEYLAARLSEGPYKVVPSQQIRERLKQQKAESYRACYDESCQIEIGRELAAQKTLSTQILRIAGTCQVTSQLFDLRS